MAASPQSAQIDKRRVFVVHGRNLDARQAMFEFLRAVNLDPIEWEEAIRMTNQATPYIGNVLDQAFANSQAAVVLITGDDLARLGKRFLSPHDSPDERQLTKQARANVIFEAGMAFGKFPDRTVIVSLGRTREFSDVIGRNILRISDKIEARQKLADRLKIAGCDVRIDGKIDWHTAGRFEPAMHEPDDTGSQNNLLTVVNRSANLNDRPEIVYKVKVNVDVRNESDETLDVRDARWRNVPGGINGMTVEDPMRLRLGNSWCPEKISLDRLHVPSGYSVRIWMKPEYDVAKHTAQEIATTLDDRCKSSGPIGRLALRVNGKDIEITV